jgi:glycosyltransferase involved in cell wall biosynthesis
MESSGPASIIIGTHNDADILESTLAALAVQSFRDFELVLADDGSIQDYAPVLNTWAPRFLHGIQYVTHEKRGFRKTRILNCAIHVSRFERLIVMDMDCLPQRDFVRNHLSYLKPRIVITGRRTHISPEVVPPAGEILASGLGFGPARLLSLWLQGKARIIEHGFVSPILYESSNLRLHGSNFSVCRSDLVAVNGFNEEFEGWGKEDSELGLRLQFSGARIRNLRNKVIQYHRMHSRLPADNPRNDAIFERTKSERMIRARTGLDEVREGDFTWTRYGAAQENSVSAYKQRG